MFSSTDLERLIMEKKRQIQSEKIQLGLSPPDVGISIEDHNDKENVAKNTDSNAKKLRTDKVLTERNENKKEEEESRYSEDDPISPELDRYIRKYLGLPVMLKAGEYSPNNPLVRGERTSGDVLLGIGEYERRRNTLRKLRQQQYREYLDEQAKKKQEAKEKAEIERRERERKEREEDERDRQRLEQDRLREEERKRTAKRDSRYDVPRSPSKYVSKVDTGVQVGVSRPLSVAVQTDDADLHQLSTGISKQQLTQAERELSPHSVPEKQERRASYCGDFADDRQSQMSKNREKASEHRTYMPSILDAEAIHKRNLQVEQDAAARRQFYQKELQNQIEEQKRIKEERRAREKMLEVAEMRRLEGQLNMLRLANERESDRQKEITGLLQENKADFDKKRTRMLKEIDEEKHNYIRATSLPHRTSKETDRRTDTAQSDTIPSKLPLYYPKIYDRSNEINKSKPYSMNIPENSIFSPNYDVESYLRKNLNPSRENLLSSRIMRKDTDKVNDISKWYHDFKDKRTVTEKVIIHDHPKESPEKPILEKEYTGDETLPIPVLKHSPRITNVPDEKEDLSEGMKLVEDKWKVPIVQKNILKSMPNNNGKNLSILTQLGSIRRQLQLEQLKLDKMADGEVKQ